ncbi:MAG: hypothetical protein QOD06_2396 [Candidatus Binatota bacterium]|jgi:glycosyltransferase involved in cell wall biosynthesis|nr:hypothetical protein [Candidatus Binatota bacterium]
MKDSDGRPFSRVVFVGPQRRYHAAHSGYESLARFLDAPIEHASLPPAVARASSAVSSLARESFRARVVRSVGLHWYGRERLLQELSLVPTLAFACGAVVHHLFAEESYRFGGYFPRLRGSVLIATYHQPPARFGEFVRDARHLKRLDAVIAVGREQAAFLSSLVSPERVTFVPHGVDTDFFSPGPMPAADFRCLFVGSWLRDFECLKRVIGVLAPEGVRFELVVGPGKAREFSGPENVSVSTALGEDEFRDAYRRASLFLLPVIDATANNALLEAMACGLPVVATDVGGVRDYCDAANSLLSAPSDAEGLIAAIRRMRNDAALRASLGQASRRRAVREFDWHVVADAVRGVYVRALAGSR